MGFIIDVLIAYVIKRIIRLGRVLESESWKPVTAKIDSSAFDDEWLFNCPTVHIAYTYMFEDQTYSSEDSKPFFFSRLGQEDAERFERGKTAIVRVNPQRPEKSVLRRSDQRDLVKAPNSQ